MINENLLNLKMEIAQGTLRVVPVPEIDTRLRSLFIDNETYINKITTAFCDCIREGKNRLVINPYASETSHQFAFTVYIPIESVILFSSATYIPIKRVDKIYNIPLKTNLIMEVDDSLIGDSRYIPHRYCESVIYMIGHFTLEYNNSYKCHSISNVKWHESVLRYKSLF